MLSLLRKLTNSRFSSDSLEFCSFQTNQQNIRLSSVGNTYFHDKSHEKLHIQRYFPLNLIKNFEFNSILFIFNYISFPFKAFLITLLIALVWGQNPNPTDFDYEGDVPTQAVAGGQRSVKQFVNVHTHPKTGFTCADKQSGHYYADPEAKCAVYFVCIANERGSLSAQSFACPNGTIFSQSTRVCASHETGKFLLFIK